MRRQEGVHVGGCDGSGISRLMGAASRSSEPALMWWLWASVAMAGELFGAHTFVFGDIHAHTGASGDGGSADIGSCIRASDDEPADCGSVSDLGLVARENGLDFLATVDHVTSLTATTTPEQFETVFSLVNELNDTEDGFVTLPGAEIFVELPTGEELGHRSLLMFGAPGALAAVGMEDLQPSGSLSNVVADCAVLSAFMDDLESRFGPALLIPHHPGVDKPMATDWSCHDPRWAPVVEAYSEHGSSFEPTAAFDPPWSGWVASGSVRAALNPEGHGHRLGLVGGTDNHDTHPGDVCRTDTVLDHHPYGGGLTGAAIPGAGLFNRADLYDAFRARRTFTTTGPRLPVWLEASAGGGAYTASMGDVLLVPEGGGVSLRVTVPADDAWTIQHVVALGPVSQWPLESVSPGVWEGWIPPAGIEAYALIDVAIDGELWFEEGCEDGGMDAAEHLWLSPVWMETADTPAEDRDGDGITEAEGDCDDTNPFVYPGAPEACLMDEADHDCDGTVARDDPDCTEEEPAAEDTAEPERTPTETTGSGRAPPSKGCMAAPSGVSWAWIALAAVGLSRRRL